MDKTNVVIVDCLGREWTPHKIYADGSWNCPLCLAGVQVGTIPHTRRKCPNPACFAREGFPTEEARKILAENEQRRTEEADRVQSREERMLKVKRAREEEKQRAAEIARRAQEQGACTTCALESARFGRTPKFTKHRTTCPRSR